MNFVYFLFYYNVTTPLIVLFVFIYLTLMKNLQEREKKLQKKCV